VELAHDLKNLLLPIQAAAELLLERSLDENAKGHVRTILKQVDRMKLLVEDLLLSRNGINWRTAVNLTELVSQVARRVTEDCKVGISCLYPRIEPVYVYASETALWRVLHNLVLNAAQAAGESGKVEIRLSLDLLQKMACIEVQDSGTGIPAVHHLPPPLPLPCPEPPPCAAPPLLPWLLLPPAVYVALRLPWLLELP